MQPRTKQKSKRDYTYCSVLGICHSIETTSIQFSFKKYQLQRKSMGEIVVADDLVLVSYQGQQALHRLAVKVLRTIVVFVHYLQAELY